MAVWNWWSPFSLLGHRFTTYVWYVAVSENFRQEQLNCSQVAGFSVTENHWNSTNEGSVISVLGNVSPGWTLEFTLGTLATSQHGANRIGVLTPGLNLSVFWYPGSHSEPGRMGPWGLQVASVWRAQVIQAGVLRLHWSQDSAPDLSLKFTHKGNYWDWGLSTRISGCPSFFRS